MIDDIARLQWACRRGMLELDILLKNFLNQSYPTLTAQEKEIFVQLLEVPDPQLLAWLLGQEQPENEKWADMINRIRHDTQASI